MRFPRGSIRPAMTLLVALTATLAGAFFAPGNVEPAAEILTPAAAAPCPPNPQPCYPRLCWSQCVSCGFDFGECFASYGCVCATH